LTVIVWDGHTLAADKRAVNCGQVYTVKKIHAVRGALLATAGNYATGEAMMAWYAAGAEPNRWPRCAESTEQGHLADMWVITLDKRILKYEAQPFPMEIFDGIFCEGSGRAHAYGALGMGATAAQAVAIACDPRFGHYGCGNGIDTLTLEDARASQSG
jgi:hypothetical protein